MHQVRQVLVAHPLRAGALHALVAKIGELQSVRASRFLSSTKCRSYGELGLRVLFCHGVHNTQDAQRI